MTAPGILQCRCSLSRVCSAIHGNLTHQLVTISTSMLQVERLIDEVRRPLLGVIGKCYLGKLKLLVELDCNIQIPTCKRIQHCAGKIVHSATAAQEDVSLSHGTHMKTEKLSIGLERWISD